MTFCTQSAKCFRKFLECFLYIPLITEEASRNGFPLSVPLFIHNAFSQATYTDNVREGRIGGFLVRFTNEKNRESWIIDQGYKNFVFPHHKNKQERYSF